MTPDAALIQTGASRSRISLTMSAADDQKVVGETPRRDRRKAGRVMPGRQRNAAEATVVDLDVAQPRRGEDPPQIGFEQRSPMCGKMRVLERRETPLCQQRGEAERAQLIWRCHRDPTARRGDRRETAHERPRVLEMLDRLDRGDHVARAGGYRPAGGVEVEAMELGVARYERVADRIEPAIAIEAIGEERPERAGSAADVDEPAAADLPRVDGGPDHPVDRVVARAEALPGAR